MSQFDRANYSLPRQGGLGRLLSPTAVAVALFVLLAALDLFVPYVSFSVLFSIPLLLLVRRDSPSDRIWQYVFAAVVTIYVVFVLKQLLIYGRPPSVLLSYRIHNRNYTALMLALLGVATQAWLYWQHERSLLTYLDRDEEDEVNSTAGTVGCIGLGLLITAIDVISPMNFNLPILFVVPLYLVSWTHDRKAVWRTAFVLVVLLWINQFLSPPPVEAGWEFFITINRVLISLTLLIQAGLHSWQIERDNRECPGADAVNR